MGLRGKIILGLSGFILLAGLYLQNWLGYVYQLADHQLGAVFSREKITPELIGKKTGKEKDALLLIEEIKKFGMDLYGMGSSRSFEYYVDLKRQVLGWNLTISPEFQLEAKEFSFPIAGKFGYLGFFNEAMKEKWKKDFISRGYDVYENEIGAYSTLGYFEDPVFSTYLEMSRTQLARMILHEMAHEKLYFKNDSDFSESLASYIENPAANLYLYHTVNTPTDIIKKHELAYREYDFFIDMLDLARKALEELYSSKSSPGQMREKKEQIFNDLYRKIQKYNFKYLDFVAEIPRENFNNALLVQYRRYTPSKKNGFSGVLKSCDNDFKCWFENISKLGNCRKDIRKRFSTENMTMDQALVLCQ